MRNETNSLRISWVYALDYTSDVRTRGGAPDTTGYCLRLAGRDLYSLPTN
jgi:hypothetical protein